MTMAGWEQGKNPFLNELVIDNISKYLSFEELKVCRGLNHLWKKTTHKMFLKCCPPIFLTHHSRSAIPANWKMMIPKFMEIYSDPNHPHPHAQLLRKYRNFFVVGLKGKGIIPIFYNFMTEVGPQMTSLKLVNVQVLRNSQDLVDILSSKYTPNLEILELIMIDEIDNSDSEEEIDYQRTDAKLCIKGKENKHLRRLYLSYIKKIHKVQWLNLWSLYPKLKTLTLNGIPVDIVEEIAAGMVTIRKANETKLKLAELEISKVYRTGYTETEKKASWRRIGNLLKTANLPLTHISLDRTTSVISSALIKHCRENVTSLTLKDGLLQPLPLMKALENLDVEQKCRHLSFLTKVPNLKSLCFDPFPHHTLRTYFPESTLTPLLSLIELETGFWKEWNVTEMEQLSLWMPNVQNVKMRLNNTTFSCICQHLPNLKDLTVWGEDLDDFGVVGDFDGALFEGCRPNITNLKALETFKMGSSAIVNKGLTEKSVFYGFSRMPKLSNLDINVKSELSRDAMLALNRGIKNVRVRIASE